MNIVYHASYISGMVKIRLNTQRLIRLGLISLAISLLVLMLRGCAIARNGGTEPDADADGDGGEAMVSIYDAEADKVYSLPLEEYVLRVTAAEMPASFSEEALKAQSVAARTYTARRMRIFGGKPCGRGGADVCTDSTCCQAYRTREELCKKWGDAADMYFAKLDGAVSATRGIILTYGGKPIEALFHSSSGGMTEDAANVFGGNAPYLKSVSSPGEEAFSHYGATVSFTRAQFAAAVNAGIKGADISKDKLEEQVKILETSESGRVMKLKLGKKTVSGRELRRALGLNSTAFTMDISPERVTLSTRGYGHGVGMSQYGAEAMARRGADYEEILLHYYTGAKAQRIDCGGIK